MNAHQRRKARRAGRIGGHEVRFKGTPINAYAKAVLLEMFGSEQAIRDALVPQASELEQLFPSFKREYFIPTREAKP